MCLQASTHSKSAHVSDKQREHAQGKSTYLFSHHLPSLHVQVSQKFTSRVACSFWAAWMQATLHEMPIGGYSQARSVSLSLSLSLSLTATWKASQWESKMTSFASPPPVSKVPFQRHIWRLFLRDWVWPHRCDTVSTECKDGARNLAQM